MYSEAISPSSAGLRRTLFPHVIVSPVALSLEMIKQALETPIPKPRPHCALLDADLFFSDHASNPVACCLISPARALMWEQLRSATACQVLSNAVIRGKAEVPFPSGCYSISPCLWNQSWLNSRRGLD